jgi:hypothetical protein
MYQRIHHTHIHKHTVEEEAHTAIEEPRRHITKELLEAMRQPETAPDMGGISVSEQAKKQVQNVIKYAS